MYKMAFNMLSRLTALTLRVKSYPSAFGALSSGCGSTVEHDRQNQRFTVSPGSGAGKRGEAGLTLRCPGQIQYVEPVHRNLCGGSISWSRDCAALHYRFTGEKEVDLMSTYVPETFRGQGVAALLSQAAMDFLVEENLKAHISCWYIKKYIEDHPLQHYKELVIT